MNEIDRGIKEYIKNPYRVFNLLAIRGFFNWMDDERYLRCRYKATFGKKLDLDNPQTFNEKLQWLKLYDRRPEYTTMVDKYAVKNYVADIIGEEYIIPTLGVYNHFDEIDFDALPDQFVLKCTHDSGGLVIVRDKSTMDMRAAKKKLERALKRNFYYVGREWPYKDVPRRIIAEKYMQDNKADSLTDYKIYTFNGKAKFMGIYRNRPDTRADYFDRNFNCLGFTWGYPHIKELIEKPENFEEMFQLAETLAKDTTQLRTDVYEINGKLYFGELTFFDGAGFDAIEPREWDQKLGEMIRIAGGGIIHLRPQEALDELTDYKFFCFNGVPQLLYISNDLSHHARTDFFDMEFNHLDLQMRDPNAVICPSKPVEFEKMKELAGRLSVGIPCVRVDFYVIGGQIYFGELTFFHCSGFAGIKPEEWNWKLGAMLKI